MKQVQKVYQKKDCYICYILKQFLIANNIFNFWHILWFVYVSCVYFVESWKYETKNYIYLIQISSSSYNHSRWTFCSKFWHIIYFTYKIQFNAGWITFLFGTKMPQHHSYSKIEKYSIPKNDDEIQLKNLIQHFQSFNHTSRSDWFLNFLLFQNLIKRAQTI